MTFHGELELGIVITTDLGVGGREVAGGGRRAAMADGMNREFHAELVDVELK